MQVHERTDAVRWCGPGLAQWLLTPLLPRPPPPGQLSGVPTPRVAQQLLLAQRLFTLLLPRPPPPPGQLSGVPTTRVAQLLLAQRLLSPLLPRPPPPRQLSGVPTTRVAQLLLASCQAPLIFGCVAPQLHSCSWSAACRSYSTWTACSCSCPAVRLSKSRCCTAAPGQLSGALNPRGSQLLLPSCWRSSSRCCTAAPG